ncbi:efflux RND transporter permease subunit [Simiduia aestuariiviva]|uniref:Multidrug efflux pump subunit AcrB n=1 Tax=Simiduia aestuariiviva TaxID=1510459 RepID=A0A839UP04_9GAMM|nr:efflux RND transporter permease subunit [Simiduia aestuariiviva]MBB3169924.1 multidrug efflux pump subunit AcrB [Simiduia aestuariiviva]
MNFTKATLRNPPAAIVAIVFAVAFGLFSLAKLPIQLFPDIENPVINIQAGWRAASPKEMESEIVEPIEEVLQGLPGVKEVVASSNAGWAWINLTFSMDTDMQKTLLDVISRMNRLKPLPRDATQPIISLGGGGSGGPALTWYFLQVLPGNDTPVDEYIPFVEEVISPAIESIPGVASARVGGAGGGNQEELQIRFDPYRAAQLGIQLPAVAGLVSQSNDVSGGRVDVGRRQYTLRMAGRFKPEELGGMVLDWRDGKPITLGDIADISVRKPDRFSLATQNGNPAIGIEITRESGANVLATLNAVKAKMAELRDGPVAARNLTVVQSFDASVFIYRAINLVTSNIFLGVLLAVGVLWWFLRRLRATAIVALSIPISLLSTFIVLQFTGRTLNVISLAGLAFAVGMVLDAAIVVLENVVRLREQKQNPDDSATQGTSEVWGALLASTATTVAIFLPVVFLKDVEGQLFSDLALTITIAVSISLLVAITVVPLLASRWLKEGGLKDHNLPLWTRITGLIMRLTHTPKQRWSLIAGLISAPLLAMWLLLPEMDYLPPVKRDAVDTFFRFPPATNIDTIEKEIIAVINERMGPYMRGEKEPALKNFYVLVWPGGGTMGARALDQSKVEDLLKVVREEITVNLPDTQAFSAQGNLFGQFGGNRAVPLHLQASDPKLLAHVAERAVGWVNDAIPQAQARVEPGTSDSEPELRLTPNDRALQELGWNRRDMGAVIRMLGQGLWVGEHFDAVKRMDVILRTQRWDDPETLASLPLATPSGAVVPLSQLASIERTVGPNQIRRIDRRRTLTLMVVPPEDMSLEKAIATLRTEVEPKIREALASGNVQYGGSADNLNQALGTMAENFAVALLILFLLMSVLFRSPKDSALVLLAMPLAMVGGVIALQILNWVGFQPLDLLTMIGFVIMLGLVVNNAILLVHQTRSAEREGMNRHLAVEQALMLRLRPIFMSTLTSLFGMLPLLLMPGEGSVIYRGLAAVIVGGMSVSTVFTLVLLPCFLRMGAKGQLSAHDIPPGSQLRHLKSVA